MKLASGDDVADLMGSTDLRLALGQLDTVLRDLAFASPESCSRALERILAGGKRLRACLTWCAASAPVGVERAETAPAKIKLMAAVELLHAGTLIHDDVIDGSPNRRGAQSLHTVIGADGAIVIGDRLLAESARLAVDAHPAAATELASAFTVVCDAQFAELTSPSGVGVSRGEVIDVATGKTARLFRASCAAGGLLAGADPNRLAALAEFGSRFGLAYQMLDDIKDFLDPAGDLANGVFTLPVAIAVERDPAVVGVVNERLVAGDVHGAIERVAATGSIGVAVDLAADELTAAVGASLDLGGHGGGWLRRLAEHYLLLTKTATV